MQNSCSNVRFHLVDTFLSSDFQGEDFYIGVKIGVKVLEKEGKRVDREEKRGVVVVS